MTAHAYFEQMYQDSPDPWSLAERVYERRKYDLTVACLPRPTYRRTFEPGCSIGMLTAKLAAHCDDILASDPIAAPLEQARDRAPDATFVVGAIPQDWPEGTFDLIVFSELLYYLSAQDRRAALDRAAQSLEPGGHLIAVHWRHDFEVATCNGDTVHDELQVRAEWHRIVHHIENDFRLDVFERGTS